MFRIWIVICVRTIKDGQRIYDEYRLHYEDSDLCAICIMVSDGHDLKDD